jgi:hypothetical protein
MAKEKLKPWQYAGLSPVQRTTAVWRHRRDNNGSDITWQPVERRFGKGAAARKTDLFGFGDYLYMENGDTVLVQIGGPGTHKPHKEKILAEPRARQWLECHNKILLVTWSQKCVAGRGSEKRWQPRWEEIVLEDFEGSHSC